MERALLIFGDARYQRIAQISVGHLYNLRHSIGYQRQRQVWTKTRPVTAPIGERRAPASNNRPGYLRVDTVPQIVRAGPIRLNNSTRFAKWIPAIGFTQPWAQAAS